MLLLIGLALFLQPGCFCLACLFTHTMHKTTIFIIQLYFINQLLHWKVLVVSLRFYLRKRCHKTSCPASVCILHSKAIKIHTFYDDCNNHQTLAMPRRCIAENVILLAVWATVYNCSQKTRSEKELDKCG